MTTALPALFIAIADGVIDFGWGHPSPRLHPVALMQKATAHLFAHTQEVALQYGAEQGFGPLLESLAAFLSQQVSYAMTVHPSTLFMTAGASQAIDMACTLLSSPGDTVFVEEPTYYLIQRIFADHHLNVLGVPTDAQGLCTDALASMLADPRVPRPRLLYSIPTFQNPAGSVLPAERRQALVALAQQYQFTVLADEVYHLLHYGAPPPPPLAAFDTSADGCVVSMGSFSKILAPGLRLGWIQAQPPLVQRFVRAGMVASGGGLSHFAAALAHATLELGLLQDNLSILRQAYGERVQTLTSALRQYVPPHCTFPTPTGGYFVWLTGPPGLDTVALLPVAQQAGVSYRPGPGFSPSGAFRNAMRLSFALYEAAELVQGAQRLGRVLTSL